MYFSPCVAVPLPAVSSSPVSVYATSYSQSVSASASKSIESVLPDSVKWNLFVSIVLGSVRICPRRPEQGNTSSGHAFDLIGIPPLPGSLRGALSGCDGSRRFSCRFNARPVTGRKYHYCFCFLWPSVRMRRTVRLKRSCGLSVSPTAEGR